MRVLVLFKVAVATAFRSEGHDVCHVNPDPIVEHDILPELDMCMAPTVEFDLVWATPPMLPYRLGRFIFCQPRDGEEELMRKTIEIIAYYRPRTWFIENWRKEMLRHRHHLGEMTYRDVEYEFYGATLHKIMRVWTNCYCWEQRTVPVKQIDLRKCTLEESISTPPALVEEIMGAIRK